ncbi:DUF885 domain-containing protein [Corynebacterium gerontici]|nr:DUF885 domain-containing protein [Corynebacterium gerontici]
MNTALDQRCEDYVQALVQLSPLTATAWGMDQDNATDIDAFTPEYHQQMADLARELRDFAQSYTAQGPQDEVTRSTLIDRLGVELEAFETGEHLRHVNNITCPVQWIRDTLLQMPAETEQQCEVIAARVANIPAALGGYKQCLELGQSRGLLPAARQVVGVQEDLRAFAKKLPVENTEVSAFLDEFARWMGTLDCAEEDAVGRERYELASRQWVGATVNLEEAYAWGKQRLAEIVAEQERIAAKLYGEGTSVQEAMQRLNQEERYTVHGVEALKAWMQERSDEALNALAGEHFDIEGPARQLECCIDPAGTGGIFYTPPSADFSRPGRMWWSVPAGQEEFHTWQELTTVYHEGVPGHHLQCSAAMQQPLNTFRRIACWNSGHGEGWALYAEQLMAELGYHEDPATRMGLLDAQRLRAARVVLDIGFHLGLPNPDGGEWDYEYAWEFLATHSSMDVPNRRFELMRYLGWPGQAPSYALGQRLWEQLRDDALAQGMSLREFHSKALAVGSVPMSILREAVLGGK